MMQKLEHLNIGAIVFPEVDQADFTGPFEILSRIPNATFYVLWKELTPVRDVRGLIIVPEKRLEEAPVLDVLIVPGGSGQEALMDDEVILKFIRAQAENAQYVLSVCTGALLCGAAGLLRGVRATTHWSVLHLLAYFGAIAVDERVVLDGKQLSAAGVTGGLDGALRLVSLLRGDAAAEQIQLMIEYSPEPPFSSGSPATAPPEILRAVQRSYQEMTAVRLATAQRIAERLGIGFPRGEQD